MSSHNNSLADDFLAPPEADFRTLLELLDLQREHGGNVLTWARETGLGPEEITDFSASINPMGPPPTARRAFFESYREISRYPDVEVYQLREELARHHGVKAEEVYLGNGSTQLIYLLCRALRPRKALVVLPAFSEYSNALKLVGTEVRSYFLSPERDFGLPAEEFMEGWKKDLSMVFLSNPNSVTGQIITKATLEEIAGHALRKKIFLVVDEAFMDFVERESVKELVQQNPYLIVLRSLTKYYALPGLRIGYVLAQDQVVKLLASYQEPWSVNGPAQKVALACLADATFRSKTTQWLEQERPLLLKGLSKLKGLQPYPSRANFVLVGLQDKERNALDLRSFLLQRKILIRACDSFAGLGAKYFRVAVGRRRDNRRLLKTLDEFIHSLRPSH
jgi:threonine-phosphate decarboxylase